MIEFQKDHFVNFHKLMGKLNVEVEEINGGSSALFLANGRYVQASGGINGSGHPLWHRSAAYCKLIPIVGSYVNFLFKTRNNPLGFHARPISDLLKNKPWQLWQKMLLMYAYSIPYRKIDDFPSEMAVPLLRHSGPTTKWTRIKGGVYTYFEKMLMQFGGTIHLNSFVKSIRRNNTGVELSMASGELLPFDKVIFATPPDQVLMLLADASEMETKRFSKWQANLATTVIHTDTSFYERYGVNYYSEFDVFQKNTSGDCGYNAYLNRLCGFQNGTYSNYSLSYNLDDWLDQEKIIHEQQHTTPLYTTAAIRYRQEVIATNGENHTYHAGAYLNNGLHEGAIISSLVVSKLLGGTEVY